MPGGINAEAQPVSDMRGKWIPVTVGFVLFGLAVGTVVWRGRRHPVPPPAAATAAAIAVARNEITLQGKIRPRHVTGVAASVPGFIEAFLVEPGQDVYQGQVLARASRRCFGKARPRGWCTRRRSRNMRRR